MAAISFGSSASGIGASLLPSPARVTPEQELRRLEGKIAEAVARVLPVTEIPELVARYRGRCPYLTNWYKALNKAGWLEGLMMPPMPEELLNYIEAPCPFYPGHLVKDTHVLFYLPSHVRIRGEFRPLTLNTLLELFPALNYVTIKDILCAHGDTPIKDGWRLMTREVIPKSRNRTYTEQQEMLRAHPGYEMPHAPEVVAILLLESLLSNTYLLGRNPWRYTRCIEMFRGEWPLVVGGFAPGSLEIIDYCGFGAECHGVVGRRKF